MPNKHERAWRFDEADGGEFGVLIECGSDDDPYWWFLCPATATLHTDKWPDLTDCNFGDECDHDTIHEAAHRWLNAKLENQRGQEED